MITKQSIQEHINHQNELIQQSFAQLINDVDRRWMLKAYSEGQTKSMMEHHSLSLSPTKNWLSLVLEQYTESELMRLYVGETASKQKEPLLQLLGVTMRPLIYSALELLTGLNYRVVRTEEELYDIRHATYMAGLYHLAPLSRNSSPAGATSTAEAEVEEDLWEGFSK